MSGGRGPPLPSIRLFMNEWKVPPARATRPTALSTTVMFERRTKHFPPSPPAWMPPPLRLTTTFSRFTSVTAVDCFGIQDANPADPGAAEPIEGEAANHDDGGGARADGDRVEARLHDGGEGPRAVDGNRLEDGHRTKIAGVEHVDLAAGGRLGLG